MTMTQQQIDQERRYQLEKRQQEHADAKAFYERSEVPQKKRRGKPGNIAHALYPDDVPV